jgi:hypothetical protein
MLHSSQATSCRTLEFFCVGWLRFAHRSLLALFSHLSLLLLPKSGSIPNEPRVINVDKNAAYPKAFAELKAEGCLPERCELRQVKYLNNLVEQDHCFIKRLTKPGMGFFSFETAWRTRQGYEVMNMLRKGQLQGVVKGDERGQVALIAKLFGVAAEEHLRGPLTLHFFSSAFLQYNLSQGHGWQKNHLVSCDIAPSGHGG